MKPQMQDLDRVLYTEEQIKEIVAELAARISRDYEGKNLLIVILLKGAFVFAADLVRRLSVPCQIECMSVSSYGAGSTTSGSVEIRQDVTASLEHRDVLLVEDIVDTGVTLFHLRELLEARHPNSLEICALLDKPSRRLKPVDVKYSGRTVPDDFIVGYGLDYADRYRDLPCIGALKREFYEHQTSADAE